MTTRREVLKFGAGTAALAIGAHTLGLDPAIAQVPAKIVIARLPINTIHTLYMGAGDWFKDEGLTVDYFMSPAGPAVEGVSYARAEREGKLAGLSRPLGEA